jgi:hypothetical protein
MSDSQAYPSNYELNVCKKIKNLRACYDRSITSGLYLNSE